MEDFKSYRESSRKDFGTKDAKLNLDQIQTGAILRIADATELMAKNYTQMEKELKWYKEREERYAKWLKTEQKRTAALKGHITRLKKQK